MKPSITLYTTHLCPWAHRVHIVLKELGIPYEEVIIDLDKPRDDWYLKINPRGLVPSMRFTYGPFRDQILTESAVIVRFLADCHSSHLQQTNLPDPAAAFVHARVALFADIWVSRIVPEMLGGARSQDAKEKELSATKLATIVKENVEPALHDAAPFFAGHARMTMAEVLTAPFLIRLYAYSEASLLPTSLKNELQSLSKFSAWADRVISQESVTYVWDQEAVISKSKSRMAVKK
ncbi:hypothetical protein CFAM422_010104 [Trichoderma lentiforme]|uniref:GST N-terminal domain-containing protein n=1 Tax=Trichoderma lentiforme TaxID=1567552 RepID=A0A9P5C8A9_9HYPO|nr:hypothetical protein CFAM422_010104 [Trichoderma lentiforme]